MKKYAILVAGGTGGHINAALAIGEKLSSINYEILYLTGQRPLDFKLYKSLNIIHLSSWPLRTKNPLKLFLSLTRNFFVFIKILINFLKRRPEFVVGAGGYVCGPTLLAAWLIRIPTFIVEQNAVMGLTNKILSRFSQIIFVHFKETKGIPSNLLKKIKVVGNPVRQSIRFAKKINDSDHTRILVFGGSLGADQINEAIQLWKKTNPLKSVKIVHQTGKEESEVQESDHQRFKYLDNIQEYYDWCDVIICRSGASTVAELRIVGKPCLLIPFPAATDNHQWWNALQLKDESSFTVEVFNPKDSQENLMQCIQEFIDRAIAGKLETSQSALQTVDSSETTVREITEHVRTIQKS